jgi:predicted dehydrogenase
VLDLLIHDVDMCLSLFGWPAAISAMGERDPAAGVDCLNAVLFYPDGLNVLIAGGWYPGDYPFSMEYTVTFEGGTLEYSSPSGRPPTLYRPGAPAQPLTPAARDPYSAEIEYFAECCRNRREPVLCPASESARAVRLALLLQQARERKGEKLECML